jgi:hypothetical protein
MDEHQKLSKAGYIVIKVFFNCFMWPLEQFFRLVTIFGKVVKIIYTLIHYWNPFMKYVEDVIHFV